LKNSRPNLLDEAGVSFLTIIECVTHNHGLLHYNAVCKILKVSQDGAVICSIHGLNNKLMFIQGDTRR